MAIDGYLLPYLNMRVFFWEKKTISVFACYTKYCSRLLSQTCNTRKIPLNYKCAWRIRYSLWIGDARRTQKNLTRCLFKKLKVVLPIYWHRKTYLHSTYRHSFISLSWTSPCYLCLPPPPPPPLFRPSISLPISISFPFSVFLAISISLCIEAQKNHSKMESALINLPCVAYCKINSLLILV